MSEELVNVSDLNQHAYCPRRYWYLHFYDTQGRNYERIEGKTKHENQSERGNWLNELYLESERLGLKGKIDVLDLENGRTVPVERKRAESGDYYKSDEVQLAGYCMLLEDHLDEPVRQGAIYLYETDQRMHVPITEDHRETVREQIDAMQSMTVDSIPPFTDNPKKCEACSAREYCLPEETARLEPKKVRGTGWEGRI
ncbi:CRISPR-associated protein Cas4 [Natrarchaeobaculum sulfurireducens]|uniref:CRISPR-associated exonuclease Cas4 n=1 Tax=Natrarchaeobaculum sulfurireducens TaxID=2044521 RepID=A0A346PDA1_9EURY|nr:CRISPR-associated protein Cas4 [Natrarchaeobaculum sulfurireducens]AXR77496.1 CRISPR-associated protein Cas4 [Natrarchaeobaculum sulfurireducens]